MQAASATEDEVVREVVEELPEAAIAGAAHPVAEEVAAAASQAQKADKK